MTHQKHNLIDRRNKALGPTYTHFYDSPLHIVRGEGVWLFDSDGKRYLDCYNNVPSVGHCNPEVTDALCEQARTLNTHTRYLHENVVEYAEMLTATMPEDDYVALLVCTGTEANDLAYRIASTVTGRKGVIITENVYHGNSTLVSELSPSEGRTHPCPDFIAEIAAPDSYRGVVDANAVDWAVERLSEKGHQPGMQFIEGAFENPGLFTPEAEYFQSMANKTRAAGGLVIVDEVQSGLCRQGENIWSYQNAGLVPDIVTMGKPLGCGHPLAATVVRREVIDEFGKITDYFNTFGGNPVSTAAGKAVLNVIHRENILHSVYQTGMHFREGLRKLQAQHSIIGDIRGKGLFIGVDIVKDPVTREHAPDTASHLIELLREEGMLVSTVGVEANVLKIRPPLVFNIDHADMALDMMSNAFDSL
ncbi:MAG: aspartate aminotransferase family protein [Pseudomonadota bacterium]